MAQLVQVLLTDDISGEEADETVGFSLDGQGYEIDLTSASAEALRESLSKYVSVARAMHPPARGRVARSRSRAPRADTSEARKWLQTVGGHPEVKDRGRIPAELLALYKSRATIRVPGELDTK